MLERFTVSDSDAVRVSERALRTTVTAIFEHLGVPQNDAAVAADVLVMSDLRGVESHGVSNMLRRYVEWYRDGTLNPLPGWTVLHDAPSIASIDGGGGLGLIHGPRAMRLAIEKARNTGVGVVTVRNSGHLGPAGHHALIAAESDMVGISMSAAGPQVLPTFGAEPRLGTNPIAYAAPTHSEPFLLFDVSTTVLAANKLALLDRLGKPVEPGWIARTDGTPIMERIRVPERGEYAMLPLGGTREHGSHKGYGLGLLTEVMSTLLSGAIPSMIDPTSGFKHHLTAYDIRAFTDLNQFKLKMDAMLRTLRNTRPAPDHDRVIYPGVLEHEAIEERRRKGIPLHPEVIAWFDEITAEMSMPKLDTM